MPKTIGLLGGMSWESSLEYYRILNELYKARLGGWHSCPCLMYSFDFSLIEVLQSSDRWDEATDLMITAARNLERGGADGLLICANTMHRMAGAVSSAIGIPLLHIADATGEAIRADGLRTVGLLGTAFVMEQAFYRQRLAEHFGLEVLVPDEPGRQLVHDTIFGELVLGKRLDSSRARVTQVITTLAERGAQAVVLGCTELPMLISPEDSPVPIYDTLQLHAEGAINWALSED